MIDVRMIAPLIAGTIAGSISLGASSHGDGTLYDNGDTDGTNGYSNLTVGVFGARRTLLDDFEVPEDAVWTIGGLRHVHIWNTLPPGSGHWMEIDLRADDGRTPGAVIHRLKITGYEEFATGRVMFDRAEAESWTTFDPVELPAGRYWFEATIVGPEQNFWLVHAEPHHEECWINYEDLGGLQPQPWFGIPVDMAWRLCGTTTACVGDVDADGVVDIADLLVIVESWGASGGPADVTNDGEVDIDDLLSLLAAWGPCLTP